MKSRHFPRGFKNKSAESILIFDSGISILWNSRNIHFSFLKESSNLVGDVWNAQAQTIGHTETETREQVHP